MPPTNPQDTQALVLHFDGDTIYSPGQALDGHLMINLALARRDGIGSARIYFRGTIETYVTIGSVLTAGSAKYLSILIDR